MTTSTHTNVEAVEEEEEEEDKTHRHSVGVSRSAFLRDPEHGAHIFPIPCSHIVSPQWPAETSHSHA